MADIKALLGDLQSNTDGITLAAFADISAGMVLASASGEKTQQEILDRLCAEARNLLGTKGAQALELVAGETTPPEFGYVWHNTAAHVFVASSAEPDEAIICVVDPTLAPQPIVDAAKDVLAKIADGNE